MKDITVRLIFFPYIHLDIKSDKKKHKTVPVLECFKTQSDFLSSLL